MSLSRRSSFFRTKAGKRDANHQPIADGLRKLGHLVCDLAGAGEGIADLAVLPHGANAGEWKWLEIKTKNGTPTPAQEKLHAQWALKGVKIHMVRSLDDALEALR